MKALAAVLLATSLGLVARADDAKEVTIKLSVLPGLKFDQPRFAVPPGAKVTVVFHNPDQMIHNFVVTAPGARMDVVNAALALGADGMTKNFIPDTPKVLWHTKALAPGETDKVTFTVPAEEKVLPYVCTFPGHGFIMYGAMYVTTKPLPPLESDPNVAPAAPVIADASDHSHHHLDKPTVSRTFLPDCGPAAIAIGFPGGQSYCFDAGLCRMRYAWKGGFVDNTDHWAGKGEAMGKPVGRIYYRAPGYQPIRIGDANSEPAARWRGYELLKNGTPRLHYTIDGTDVYESAAPKADGLQLTYEISATKSVFFKTDTDSGATFQSSAGTWIAGVLTLTPEQAKHFTLTLTEQPGVEPLVYWSMNDLVLPGTQDPLPGVIGRAFTPGNSSPKPKKLESGVSTATLKTGGTLMAWTRHMVTPPAPKKKPLPSTPAIFSAGDSAEAFVINAPSDDDQWHHLAVTFKDGTATRYLDGQNAGALDAKLPEKETPLVIGSIGEKSFFAGLIDEVRIYDRVLSDAEIQKIYQREKPGASAAQSTSAR